MLDAATGSVVGTLRGHTSDVNAVAFSPDSRLLATASLGVRWIVARPPSSCEPVPPLPAVNGTFCKPFIVPISRWGVCTETG